MTPVCTACKVECRPWRFTGVVIPCDDRPLGKLWECSVCKRLYSLHDPENEDPNFWPEVAP